MLWGAFVPVVAFALAAGTVAKSQSCTQTPCCFQTESQTYGCASNSPSCDGSITLNVCPAQFSYSYPWIMGPAFCCGIEFCSLEWPDGSCGLLTELMKRRMEVSPYRSLGAWAEYVRGCSGKYYVVVAEG